MGELTTFLWKRASEDHRRMALAMMRTMLLSAALLVACGTADETPPPTPPAPPQSGYFAATSDTPTKATLRTDPGLVMTEVDLSSRVPSKASHVLLEWSPCAENIGYNYPFTLHTGDPKITGQTPYHYVDWVCGSRPPSSTDVRKWEIKATLDSTRKLQFGITSYPSFHISSGEVTVRVVGWWLP